MDERTDKIEMAKQILGRYMYLIRFFFVVTYIHRLCSLGKQNNAGMVNEE